MRGLWSIPPVLLAVALGWAFFRFAWDAPVLNFALGAERHELMNPRLLGVLLLLPVIPFVLQWSLADLPWQQRVLAGVSRAAFLVCLALGFAGLVRETRSHDVCAVFLIDVSDSIPDEALRYARDQLARALKDHPDPEAVRVITFARRPQLLELPAVSKGAARVPSLEQLRRAHTESRQAGAGSNLQAALQLAYGVFPADRLKRVVLFSDGLQTDGDIAAEALRARELGVELWSLPYEFAPPGEVAVQALDLPNKIEVGGPFKVVAQIYSSRAGGARARLYQDGVLNGLQGVRTLQLQAGNNQIEFDSVVRLGGAVTYKLELDQLSGDQFPENNSYATTVEVPGRPAVLYIEGRPEYGSYLVNALSAQQFDVDLRAATGLPSNLAELERYSLIILSDVAANKVSLSAQDAIERYVRDLGGGLIFAGGESGFGLGGWTRAPLARILPVRMDPQKRKDIPSVAMALVIDRSGSMTGLPMEMAKAACEATVGTLQGDDLVGVIAFDSLPNRYVKMQPARYRGRIQSQIVQIQPGGGTAIFPALDAAYQDISVVQARKKHVILLTDGRADSGGIRDLVQAMVSESITVTTVGVGDGVDADLLRMIADTGGGRYHAVSDPNSLPRIFTRETEMISRQSAVTEWFPVSQTTHADFLEGLAMATAPLLHGYVATEMKAPPAQQILASDTGEPILARMRVGLGQSVAWTSDIKNNWAVDWLRWSGFGRFWGQLVREHMRQKHRRELDMDAEVRGDRLFVAIDAFTVAQRFENDLSGRLFVTAMDGSKSEHALSQTAPGRYEAQVPLDRYGSFTLRAELAQTGAEGGGRATAISFGHASYPYPREYSRFEPDRDLLERAASAGAGKVQASLEEMFDPRQQFVVHRKLLWPRLIWVALGVFLLDLLMRRVRLFDRKFTAGSKRAAAQRVPSRVSRV